MDADVEPQVLWRLGDPWRDLVHEIGAVRCTAITASRATYLIDRPSGHLARIARASDTTSLFADGTWYRLDQIVSASPCGLHVLGPEPGQWLKSTPFVLLLAGIVTNWPAHGAWPRVEHLARTRGDQAWDLAAHPNEPCQALHCRLLHRPLNWS